MMAKRKYDDVEEEDSISDDLLNQHYDELEKQQYGGEISDDQLNELYDQLDQQQLDALNIDLGVGVALSLTLNFKRLDSQKIGKKFSKRKVHLMTRSISPYNRINSPTPNNQPHSK